MGQLRSFNNLAIQIPQKKCLHGKAITDFLLSRQIGHIIPFSPYPPAFMAPFASFIILKFSSLFFSLIFFIDFNFVYLSSNDAIIVEFEALFRNTYSKIRSLVLIALFLNSFDNL